MPSSFRRLPRCLLARLVSSYHLPVPCRPASLLVERDGFAISVGRLLAIAVIVRLRVPRFACVPSASRPAPRHGRRGGERRFSMLASFGFLPSAALVGM